MAKYDALREHLRTDGGSRIELAFAEIAAIVAGLPASAYEHQAWWANTRSHPEAVAWLKAGYRVDWFDLSAQRVRFIRERESAR